ncbi:polyketide synthase [Penicillium malachiteum]|uniref:polyketide synthase n=1 Tax=Penicillium malachiteum TaxID=1324776 RepID=UPI0025487DAF|nr:polyketide synthase [Penicillium malachiteum]KAJ5714630.1 polyketide synthase [Penicillium malachiteum]
MDGGSVIFFGDTTLPIIPSLAQLLEARRPNSLLSQFLSLSEEVLRESIGHLPGHVQEEALRFTRLSDIVDSEHHELPALHVLAPAILVIVQLGHFIGWYENPSHCEFPSTSKSLCIGLCVGQLSAAAVSLAKNVVELIPIAVDTVRLAVRLGSLVFTVGGDLEVEEHQDPWALLIEKEVLPDTDLASILDKWDKSSRKQPYITAEFDSTVTVQGPPTTLISLKGIILEFLKSTQSAQLDVENLVKGLTSFSKAPGLNNERTAGPALLSPYLAHAVDRERPAEIVRDVLKDLLFRPIQWKNLIEGTASYLTSLKLSEFDIYCFGPVHSHKSFISTIQDKIDAKVMLCDTTVQGDQEHSTRGLNIPIAVIGISGRFPDANSVDELWRILADGVDCHRVIPNDRFDPSIYVSKDGKDKNKSATEFGNFMKDPGQFDARFFNMSPREAMQTDPQQRLALVTAYEALELAGYVPGQTPSTQMERIGSFYGQTTDDYKDVNVVQDIDTYYVSGVIRAFGPGRVSRANQLGGPSLSVDTACASSATALNLACTSIWSNECDTAVVGGMMLLNSPDMYAGLSRGHFVSSDGPCKTFDDEADGYCRGETVASIVLKRLDAAKADNDNVLGVILAAGTNYSAYAASITQPHAGTQESLFRKVLREAAVKPKDIDYVELHGTGTQLGDSTEMASVLNVLAPSHSRRPPDRPLYVGSVKANIGHGESASGITALIKALLLFKNSQIPPHIGIKSGRINRNFPPLEERNVKIAKKLTAFPPSPDRKRKVLINNFGAAGGNSSFVLEEGDSFSQESEPVTTVRDHVISVTAKSTTSLLRNLMNLVLFIENQPQVAMRDIAYSTTARKVQHPLRVSIVASTLSEAKSKLSAKVNNEGTRSTIKLSNPIFVFTGQGSLFANVGKQIFETNSSFRTHLTRLERIAVEHGFPPFIDAIINGSEEIGTLQPVQSQVGQVALQMSLFTLWSSWNIRPSAVIGHSLGEYAALFAAGVLSASDTLYLVGRRATLLQNLCESSTHGMLAVNQSLDRVKSVLADHFNGLEASCFNTPTDIVISGPIARIHEAQPLLKAHDMRCTLLNVPFAFHSSQVDPILGPLESEASKVSFRMPRIPILSTLLGRKLNNLDALNPSYLVRHAREPVQFAEAIQSAQLDNLITSESAFLEIGPHPVCLSMVASTLQSTSRLLSTLHRKEPPIATICKALATFSDGGISINWKNYHSSFAGTPKLLSLPTYAFDEKNYWIEYRNNWLLQRHPSSSPSKVNELQPQITTTVQRILSSTIDGSVASVVFESDLANPVLHGLIAGHIIHGIALCPSRLVKGVFVDIAMTVADYLRRNFSFNGPVSGIKVINLQMTKPVIMPVERPKTPRIFRICSQAYTQTGSIRLEIGTPAESGQELETHASCEIEFEDSALWLRQWNKNSYLILERILNLEDGVTRGSSSRMSHDMVYNLFSMVVHYDQRYQGMKEVIIDAEKLEAVVSLSLHNDPDMGTFFFSPLWLDNLAQIAGFVMNAIGKVDPREFTYISHGIGSYQIGEEIRPDLLYKAHVRMLPETGTVFSGDVSIFQGERLIARCGEVKFQRVPRAVLNKILSYPAEPRTSTRKLTAPDLTGGAQKGNHNLPLRRETHTHSIIDDVKELLAEQIGISAKDLTDKSGFQELGVDSLLSMTILAQIHEVLHIQLPASTFTDFSTFGSLKQYILKNLPDQSDGSATPVSESSESVVSSTSSRSQSLPSTPPDSRLTEVYSIIADEMGLDMEELLAAESLSSLGLDSMMAITITGALNERIGIEVPSGIFDSSSAKDLHSSLNDLFGSPRFDPQRDIQNAQQRVTPRRSLPASMTLQGDSHSTSKTLFLFPDGSGLATSYAKLPRISKELQVIGLNSCLLGEKSAIPRDISLIASKMVETVRQIQPSGPYLLAGWSAGGMYSFEAARQLLEAGESVASLILIDSPCRLRFGPMPPQLLHLLSDGLTLRSEVRQNFLDTIAAVDGYTPHPLKKNSLMRVTIIWAEDGLEKTMELQPGPIDLNYNDAIVEWLLRRAGPLDAMGWDKLLPDCSLEIRTTNGNHFSMVQTPNAKSLSDAISGALELS